MMSSREQAGATLSGTPAGRGESAGAILGGQMYDTSDVQIRSLLANRELLLRALTIAALEASAGDQAKAACRVIVWIADASDDLERMRKGAK